MSSAPIPTVTLNDGIKIPKIGYGLGTSNKGKDCRPYIQSALETGYTYLDCAYMYGNSNYLGDVLAEWKGKREDLFVLQKCGKDDGSADEKDPRKVLVQLLKDIKLDYVDLYLLHSPLLFDDINKAWAIMEELKTEGLAKSIGVSNFREQDLLKLKETWKVVPSVNQIELHPYNAHAPNVVRLLDLCKENDITIQAYSPIAPLFRSPGGPVNEVVATIARDKGVEDSQVLLAWAAQRTNGVVVTTSTNRERQQIQLEAITKVSPLSQEEVDQISEAGKGRYFRWFQKDVWGEVKQ
ncbi:hypothetical protein CI109_101144 [Kwoniella shandongensis]|uniref:Uncharacterized protein n=1 Tax=Kwoniella shandongensis TaxID=1734106 RepID=A0A5M6C4Y5_9TREE|nr:uncharacterized protein CI109_001613 [Kwoniella shandongensis]KAA5530206.1 hypothetical protein CI109_001613 [Kwoniella shandongensis]